MNLTAEQIKHIHDFVKRKYVDYYDVQIELVDHIATSIEEKIEVNPKLDFHTALQQVYDGFGRFGFKDFIAEKEKQVERRFRKMYQREMGNFFTIPKVLLTLGLVFLMYQFNSALSYELSRVTILIFMFSVVAFQVISLLLEKRKLKNDLIATQYLMFVPSIMNIVNMLIGLFAYQTLYSDSIWWIVIISSSVIVGSIANYMVFLKITSEQRRLYPEAFAI